MKILSISLGILLDLFWVMVGINKSIDPPTERKTVQFMGYNAYIFNEPLPDKCTWDCALNTNYCKDHHVKFLKPYFSVTDKMYFGVTKGLGSFKFTKNPATNYGIANLLFLVTLIPLCILYCITKGIRFQKELKNRYGKDN